MRRAHAQDREAVLSFASRTWDGWDYLPHAWPVWLRAGDGVLLVGAAARPADGSVPLDREGQPLKLGRPLAVARLALASDSEAWLEGIRVDPRVRGMEVATDLQVAELHWAAAQDVDVVRYATGESNEGSHRLGARHGFELLSSLRTYGWRESDAPADEGHDEGDESGFGEPARRQASALRAAALERLAALGLLAPEPERWWARVSADATLAAAARLYEHRAWALQELSEQAFQRHALAGEVLALESADGAWAVAILEREAQPSEDVSLHLGLLVGDGAAALELASAIRQAAGTSIRFRLPSDDPPLLRGQAEAFRRAGFEAREWTLHILSRPMAEPANLPQPEEGRLRMQDRPRALR